VTQIHPHCHTKSVSIVLRDTNTPHCHTKSTRRDSINVFFSPPPSSRHAIVCTSVYLQSIVLILLLMHDKIINKNSTVSLSYFLQWFSYHQWWWCGCPTEWWYDGTVGHIVHNYCTWKLHGLCLQI